MNDAAHYTITERLFLNVKIESIVAPPLWRAATPQVTGSCSSWSAFANKDQFVVHTKNVVHKITCKMCPASDIGVNHGTVNNCMKEHRPSFEVQIHYYDVYNTTIRDLNEFSFDVMKIQLYVNLDARKLISVCSLSSDSYDVLEFFIWWNITHSTIDSKLSSQDFGLIFTH